MRTFKHRFIVNSPIDRVWEFYTDIKHLEVITPKEMEIKITNSTSQKITEGSELWLEGKIMSILSKKSRWHSTITLFSASSNQREYADEMLSGPFKRWRHFHRFEEFVEDNSRNQTQVIDQIDFELPYGIIGRLFDGYAAKKLQRLFYQRKLATIRALENNRPTGLE